MLEGEASKFGPASVSGLVTNAVEMRPDRAHTDEQPLRDISVGLPLGEESEVFLFSSSQREGWRSVGVAAVAEERRCEYRRDIRIARSDGENRFRNLIGLG